MTGQVKCKNAGERIVTYLEKSHGYVAADVLAKCVSTDLHYSTNRVPAHISRHQTFHIVAVFVGKDKQNSPPEKPFLLWRSPVSAVESRSNDHH